MTASDLTFANDVAAALTTASRAAGKAVCPPGRRSDLVLVLNRCAVNPMFRDEYVAALELEHQRLEIPLFDPLDIPDDEITHNGFANLSDDALADIALSPEAVAAVCDMLNQQGPWADADPAQVGDWIKTALAREFGLMDDSRPQGEPSSPAPLPVSSKVWHKVALWSGALAASLLLGLGIGYVVFREKLPPRITELEFVRAHISTHSVPTKGTERLVNADIESDRDGFATVVVVSRGTTGRVYPDYGGDDIRVQRGVRRSFGPLTTGTGDSIIVVVTETPASEVVRKAVKPYRSNAASPMAVENTLKEALWAAGFKWAAISTTTVSAAP